MNIYLLDDLSKPFKHPMFAHRGTWSKGYTCKKCGNATDELIEPLLIEWFDGSTEIGDFSWCGYTAIVKDHVKDWFLKNEFEVKFGRTEVVKPVGRTRRPRVAFPYVGPSLNWLVATKKVRLDERKSGIEPVADCAVCGQTQTKFVRDDIFVSRANWGGEKLFEIAQNGKSGAMFITEEASEMLALQNFTNYVTIPAGKIG